MGESDTLEASRLLPQGIAAALVAEGGRVSFARFMELALTHPQDGYYARTTRLLGHRGDFTTAPRRSPVFNKAVARLLTDLVDAGRSEGAGGAEAAARSEGASSPEGGARRLPVIELGGGEGDLAAAVLGQWDGERPDLRDAIVYSIVEIGEELRCKQRSALQEAMRHGWRVMWARGIAGLAGRDGDGPAPGSAVVFGNEFLDALPVHLVDVSGPAVREAWVRVVPVKSGAAGEVDATCIVGADGVADADGAAESAGATRYLCVQGWGEVTRAAREELESLFGTTDAASLRPLTRDGVIELRPATKVLLGEAASVAREVCLVTIDYGDWLAGIHDADACGPCRLQPGEVPHGRTLRGYFRHQVTSDLCARVGHQDLTSDVDFRALDMHGTALGFETVLYVTVAEFLRGAGAEEELDRARKAASTSLDIDREATVLAALLDPEDVGGRFKVMLQVRE